MKVRSAIKKMCAGCSIKKYNQKAYVVCKENPRHKQRQRFSTYIHTTTTQLDYRIVEGLY